MCRRAFAAAQTERQHRHARRVQQVALRRLRADLARVRRCIHSHNKEELVHQQDFPTKLAQIRLYQKADGLVRRFVQRNLDTRHAAVDSIGGRILFQRSPPSKSETHGRRHSDRFGRMPIALAQRPMPPHRELWNQDEESTSTKSRFLV